MTNPSEATLRVLIVDDEQPARTRMKKLLQPFVRDKRVQVVAEAHDGVEALEVLSSQAADLILLDIQMPGLDGFDVLDRLPPAQRPFVVFTTAYDAYALRAFEAHAIDYLLKPISKERLEDAISRVERFQQTPESRSEQDERMGLLLDWLDTQAVKPKPSPPPVENGYLQQLSIPYRDRILIAPIDDLVSIEISDGITRVFLLDDAAQGPKKRLRQHIVSYTLDQLDARLNPSMFMRVHRSAIIQVNHIRELIPWFSGRYKLILSGNHEVIASRERSKLLKERLMI